MACSIALKQDLMFDKKRIICLINVWLKNEEGSGKSDKNRL